MTPLHPFLCWHLFKDSNWSCYANITSLHTTLASGCADNLGVVTVSNWQADAQLTHLPLAKMTAILADDIFKCFFSSENGRIPMQISLKFVSGSPIVNKSALVQVTSWRRIGDKPLPEPMLTQFTDGNYILEIWKKNIKIVLEINWGGGGGRPWTQWNFEY